MTSDSTTLVPYGPDFTPTLLGREIGEDQVLPWLLEAVKSTGSKRLVMDEIVSTGFAHIKGEKNRRDMASHVVQGLQNYLLAESPSDDTITLTKDGQRILAASPEQVTGDSWKGSI